MAVNYEAVKHACALLPRAIEIVGEADATSRAQLATVADSLAEEHGVTEPFVEIAAALIEDGLPEVPARLAALWAARRFYGVDPRLSQELAGGALSEFKISVQQAAFEADREEAETRRFYREDFPAIAAARGRRVEDSRAWHVFVGNAKGGVEIATMVPLPVEPLTSLVDWPEDRIRDEFKRFWTSAERELFRQQFAAVEKRAATPLEAARYATRRVLDRRVEAGIRPAPAAAAAAPARARA